MAEKHNFSLLPKIINGGIAGIVGVTCIFPLDLVKTRLQNQQIGPRGEKMYNSMLDAFRKIYRTEGFFGMYRGSAVNILLVTPEKAMKLATNDFFRFHFKKEDGTLPVFRQVIAGAIAGVVHLVVTVPMELLKIQMQDAGRVAAQTGSKEKKRMSTVKLTMGVLKEQGIFGLYKGLTATMARDLSFAALYFPLFAVLDGLGPRKKYGSGEAVFWCSFLAGLTSGATSGLLCTPFDVVKTRLQTKTKGVGEKSYTGILDAYMSIWKHEGPLAFFKGGACRMLVIAPLYAIVQVVYFLGVGEYLLGIDKKQ